MSSNSTAVLRAWTKTHRFQWALHQAPIFQTELALIWSVLWLKSPGQKCELWLCGCVFTLADVLLGATLHRLKFLGLSKKYWEDGSRPNLQSFFDRIQKRFAFRKVLGDIHTTLLSAVVPNAFRLVKRKPPSFFGASFLMGSLGGMGYFAYWYLKKKYI